MHSWRDILADAAKDMICWIAVIVIVCIGSFLFFGGIIGIGVLTIKHHWCVLLYLPFVYGCFVVKKIMQEYPGPML